MPKQRAAGKCGSANCCDNRICRCGGVPWGTLYMEFANVAMNFAPPSPCTADCYSSPVDETWYNGMTYVVNPELTVQQHAEPANNVNEFRGFGFATTPCSSFQGLWSYRYLGGGGTVPNSIFYFGISTTYGVVGSEFWADVLLICYRSEIPQQMSNQRVSYAYPSGCPTGSYYERTRTFGTNENNGAFDFRNFTANLTWVV